MVVRELIESNAMFTSHYPLLKLVPMLLIGRRRTEQASSMRFLLYTLS